MWYSNSWPYQFRIQLSLTFDISHPLSQYHHSALSNYCCMAYQLFIHATLPLHKFSSKHTCTPQFTYLKVQGSPVPPTRSSLGPPPTGKPNALTHVRAPPWHLLGSHEKKREAGEGRGCTVNITWRQTPSQPHASLRIISQWQSFKMVTESFFTHSKPF